MKNSNRIAQRILTEAKLRANAHYYMSSEIRINCNEADELIRQIGGSRPGLTLRASVYLSYNKEIEQVSLCVTTLSTPSLQKNLTFYGPVDAVSLGEKISWTSVKFS